MTGKEFLDHLADQIIAELRPNEAIRKFTTNPTIIGAYAEASVRQIVSRVVFPLRVSTGAVISEQLCSNPKKVPQIDTIIWSPSPAPAIFPVGEFALVPRSSCFGIMEIKRSCYSGVGKDLMERLDEDKVFKLVGDIAKLTSSQQSEADRMHYPDFPGLGVICVKEKMKSDKMLNDLIQKGLAVVLFDISSGKLIPNTEAVHRLINFLILTRRRAKIMDGNDLVNIRLITSREHDDK